MSDSQTEEIKRRIDIVDFIGQYVQLKQTGQNWKGLCPFHNEKTGSFMVHRERQIYRCFGCSEAGDIFDFVQKIEGLDFYESLKFLAQRAGIELKPLHSSQTGAKTESKTEILALNKTLALLYHQLLKKHKSGQDARSYVKSRKLSDEIIDKFIIGYAPQHIDRVHDYLSKMGFSDADMAKAGNPERFRNRLMFPIADIVGNIVGFSGRALEKGQEPKYLNTRETPVFHKARVLYGFDVAKQEIRKQDSAVVVEGQMDVVLSHQAGVTNTVATSGTALTEDHLLLIRRQTDKVCFMFDADEAGEKTTLKALEMAWRLELQIKVAQMPEGFKDAGEVVEKDPKLLSTIVNNAKPGFDWLISHVSNKADIASVEGRKYALRTLSPIISAVADAVEREGYVKKLALLLGSSEDSVVSSMKKTQSKSHAPQTSSTPAEKDIPKTEGWVELMALLNLAPRKIGDARKTLEGKLGEGQVARLYETVFKWYDGAEPPYALGFLKVLPADVKKKVEVAEVGFESQNDDAASIELDIDQRLEKIKNRLREKVKTDFAQKIAQAERTGDIEQVKTLMQELQKKII